MMFNQLVQLGQQIAQNLKDDLTPQNVWNITYLLFSIGEICRNANEQNIALEEQTALVDRDSKLTRTQINNFATIRNYLAFALLHTFLETKTFLLSEKEKHIFLLKNMCTDDFKKTLRTAYELVHQLSPLELYDEIMTAYTDLTLLYTSLPLDMKYSETLNNELSMRLIVIGKCAKLLKDKIQSSPFAAVLKEQNYQILSDLNNLRKQVAHSFITQQRSTERWNYIKSFRSSCNDYLPDLNELKNVFRKASQQLKNHHEAQKKLAKISSTSFTPRSVEKNCQIIKPIKQTPIISSPTKPSSQDYSKGLYAGVEFSPKKSPSKKVASPRESANSPHKTLDGAPLPLTDLTQLLAPASPLKKKRPLDEPNSPLPESPSLRRSPRITPLLTPLDLNVLDAATPVKKLNRKIKF